MTLSQLTKMAFAKSLKKLLEQKKLNKITINDIVSNCGLNRQTFYYHFKDIYDLLDWIIEKEFSVSPALEDNEDVWRDVISEILQTLKKNKEIVLNLYKSLSREKVDDYINKSIYEAIKCFVRCHFKEGEIPKETEELIINFYKYAFSGFLINWIQKGMNENAEELMERVMDTMYVRESIIQTVEKHRKK